MKNYKKTVIFGISGIFALALVISLAFVAYLYTKRYEPILYRSQDGANNNFASVFVQNPFRDKTSEIVANNFLLSIKGKTVTESLTEDKNVAFNNPKGMPEVGRLTEWELWNRFDNADKTLFYFAIYRKDEIKNPEKDLLSFVVVELRRENLQWKVAKYTCDGTSNNS